MWLSLPLFVALAGGVGDGELRAADLTWFTNADGLLADPTGLDRGEEFETVSFPDVAASLGYLADRFIIIGDDSSYDGYFAKKRSMVDQDRFGTFHQQLGAELLLRQRVAPQEWWYRQKFDLDAGTVRRNLYKLVQEPFLDRYFSGLDLNGKTVLDFGCGTGMASARFAAAGAHVIGVDPNEGFLAEATRSIGSRFVPVPLRLSDPDPLAVLPREPVDLVWLADVLMFYFYPMDAGTSPVAPAHLLSRLTANLNTGGRCVVMQPHGVFWLAPWLGDPRRPYTVITEYTTRLYSVTPSLQEMSDAIAEAGLCITRIYEPGPDHSDRTGDARAHAFAGAFPQWWVFECARL